MKSPQISILVFVMSLANVLGILFVAALPDLTKSFQITKAQGQETISIYLIGCVLAQIIYPALSKAFGRKGALYTGCSLAILGSALCLLSVEIVSFSLLLLGRFMAAIGAASGSVLTGTIVSESFTPSESKKKFSHLMSGFIIIPSLSVVLGGFITQYLSWEKCFYFMFLYSIFVTAIAIFLPETAKEKSIQHLHIAKIAKSYWKELFNAKALLYGFILANASIILFLFASEAPFLSENRLHIPAKNFGLYNLIPNLGFFLGAFFCAKISQKTNTNSIIITASSLFFIVGLIMWILFQGGHLSPAALFGLPFFIFAAAAFILPNGYACALATTDDKPYLSSIIYVIQYLWVAIAVAALRFFPSRDAAVLPMAYTLAGALMIILWFIVRKMPCRKSQS